jgi:hypothetical protein
MVLEVVPLGQQDELLDAVRLTTLIHLKDVPSQKFLNHQRALSCGRLR